MDFDIPIELIHELQQIIGSDGVLTAIRSYVRSDGFTIEELSGCRGFSNISEQIADVIKAATGTRYHFFHEVPGLAWQAAHYRLAAV